MSDLLRRVRAFAARRDLWTPGTGVVAAVSGGSDSVALLLILHALARRGELRLAGVAHLHHHIRGAAADEDAAFVRRLAERLHLPCTIEHADVPALGRVAGESLELAGRNARLAFFTRVVARPGADCVALAHTRGDQAETVLLRLARGAGPRGLGGMAPRTGHRIRPLLDEGREELRAWLVARGESWREDETNADVLVARNRVRHEVLPRLAAINPRVDEAVARAARILAADAAVLDDQATREAARLVSCSRASVVIEMGGLARLPEALARRVVLKAFETLDPSRAYGWEETDAVLQPAAARALIGRVRLERIGPDVVLYRRGSSAPAASPGTDEAIALEVPGRAAHPAGWWAVDASEPMPLADAVSPAADRAVLDAEALGRRLTVRGWRPGDRVHPLGLSGRKKLQDVFVDRKVPRDARALVPVVLDAREEIAWVAGHVVGEAFRVTPRSATVVVLTLRR